MTELSRPLILVTNDDGIASPGLAAAAAALDPLGELLIVAPLVQQTSRGRSRPSRGGTDGKIVRSQVTYQDREWKAAAVNATPALAVQHGILELAEREVDLVVSGVNYGENVGSCVTVSGTIGAALEAADAGIPTIAISIELPRSDYYSFDEEVDFTAASYFLRSYAQRILKMKMPFDVDVLKIEIPAGANLGTKCVVTKQDRLAYYSTEFEPRDDPYKGGTQLHSKPSKGSYSAKGTDAYALAQGWVSVTPLSLDLTSRTDLVDLNQLLKD
jgi:5'-nucleotidase